ncbi:uncharacterized protein LOC124343475 [Daphnia pulicaria]|uniref:uncharacterized protein LOC124343475 n=1 Tax=Daphnia pulicaria TaxID=35523 RepID=UPI001EECCE5C|nr:uncharacterized protein LOC124343475 [Daphnia pulicaria]
MSGKSNGITKNVNSVPQKSVNKPTRFSPRKNNGKGPSKSGPSYTVKKRVSTYSWSDETIELLIQGVSEYPVLFDITRADYKDVTVHARANDAVPKGLPNNCTGADVKAKWDYLRKLWLNERRELN